jgi:hypothetical protein
MEPVPAYEEPLSFTAPNHFNIFIDGSDSVVTYNCLWHSATPPFCHPRLMDLVKGMTPARHGTKFEWPPYAFDGSF